MTYFMDDPLHELYCPFLYHMSQLSAIHGMGCSLVLIPLLLQLRIVPFWWRVPPCGTVSRQLVYGHFVYDTSSTDISSTDISSTGHFVYRQLVYTTFGIRMTRLHSRPITKRN